MHAAELCGSTQYVVLTKEHACLGAQGTECHQIIVEDWAKMEQPHGTLFLSMPSLLDPSLCPPGTHVIHAFTPDWIDNWKVQPSDETALRLCCGTAASTSMFDTRLHCMSNGPEKHIAPASQPYWIQGETARNLVLQGLSPADYERKKEEVADSIAARLEPYFPGIGKAIVFRHAHDIKFCCCVKFM